jgi:hypothetical protein
MALLDAIKIQYSNTNAFDHALKVLRSDIGYQYAAWYHYMANSIFSSIVLRFHIIVWIDPLSADVVVPDADDGLWKRLLQQYVTGLYLCSSSS